MKNRAPAFFFYASDYLADENVQLMTLEQEGAYIRLLAYCWREGSLPANPDSLAKLCKGCSPDVITVVQRLFNEAPNDKTRLVHKRLIEEREKQIARSEQNSYAGKKSAAKRSNDPKHPKKLTSVASAVEHPLNENSTFQSSFSSSTSKLAGVNDQKSESLNTDNPSNDNNNSEPDGGGDGGVPDIAHEIYRHYPVKVHDAKAHAAIQNALTVVEGEVLLAAVKAYAEQVVRTNTQHPTWPEKWFKGQMWKSYLPVDESEATADAPVSPDDDQNLSHFTPEFYQTINS